MTDVLKKILGYKQQTAEVKTTKGSEPPKKVYTPKQRQIIGNFTHLQTIPNYREVLNGTWEPSMELPPMPTPDVDHGVNPERVKQLAREKAQAALKQAYKREANNG